MNLEDGRFDTDDEMLTEHKKITANTVIQNKTDWKKYADRLIDMATKFMK